MKAPANFEAAQDTHSAKDDASTNLYNSIVNDLAFKHGATGGKNGVTSSDSTPLVQNDLPKAFRGSSDFEIVDNEIGKSLTKYQPADEVPSSGKPAGATAEMKLHLSTKGLQKLQNSINELLEYPSSGKPHGVTPEQPVRTERSDKQGSVRTPGNDSAREVQSSGHPVGARAEKLPTGHHGPIKFSRTAGKPSEARSTGAPIGATAERQLNDTSAATQRGIADNTGRDEVRSSGRPRGASAETQLKGLSTGNHNGSTAENLKQTDSTKEAPSTKKPDGAHPESRLNTKSQDHRPSTADPVQQNRGLEIEGRRRNERATQEKRLISNVNDLVDRGSYGA